MFGIVANAYHDDYFSSLNVSPTVLELEIAEPTSTSEAPVDNQSEIN